MGSMLILLVIVGLAIVVAMWGVGIYNGLVTARNAFKNAFAQIDVQLQRRFDLIPNLVETAKGYLSHERQTLEAVVAARGAAINGLQAAAANPGDPAAMAELAQTQGALNGALGRLLAVVEAYPDLKANQNFLALQSQLEGTENRIAVARRDFIAAVERYNTEIRTFPGRIWHKLMYSDMPFRENFEATAENAEQAPQVQFQ